MNHFIKKPIIPNSFTTDFMNLSNEFTIPFTTNQRREEEVCAGNIEQGVVQEIGEESSQSKKNRRRLKRTRAS